MTKNDNDALLEPVDPDMPAGPDLEYDADFLALLQAAEGTPERRMGDTVVAAEEPDWREVQKLAAGLLKRSKDLRVAVLLARASLHLSGLAGLAQGLALIQGLASRYWDQVHPQLDPSDDNDPTARVNTLLDLCAREALLDPLRATPLIRSRVFGPLAYRDIEIAEGKVPPLPDTKPLDATALSAAFQDCDPDALTEAAAAGAQALAEARALDGALAANMRPDQMPDLDPLIKLLSAISTVLGGRLSDLRPGETSDTTPEAQQVGGTADRPRANLGTTGEIASRDDVVRALDRICDYYSRNEPSSPVPLLLKRAQRLATGSFMEIMRDMAPDALAQIEKICGLEQEP